MANVALRLLLNQKQNELLRLFTNFLLWVHLQLQLRTFITLLVRTVGTNMFFFLFYDGRNKKRQAPNKHFIMQHCGWFDFIWLYFNVFTSHFDILIVFYFWFCYPGKQLGIFILKGIIQMSSIVYFLSHSVYIKKTNFIPSWEVSRCSKKKKHRKKSGMSCHVFLKRPNTYFI